MTTLWQLPECFFEPEPRAKVDGFFEASDSKAQAMDCLTFFTNRAGKQLLLAHKAKLEEAISSYATCLVNGISLD